MSINWYPGHMAKTKRLITENIKVIDIVFEVLDARIPASSKIADIDNLIKNKPRILIFNKYDLCDKNKTNKWIKHYEALGYKVVTTTLIGNKDISALLDATNKIKAEINAGRKKKGLKPRGVRVLVVGVPNVGKSTLINALVKRRAAGVGNKPGVTKGLTWIRFDKDLEMLDTPGILWPKFEDKQIAFNLASLTAIKEEVLPLDQIAVYILKKLYQHYPQKLKKRYDIDEIDFDDIAPTLEHIGNLRKVLLKGGEPNIDAVYELIVNDIKSGNIKGITFDEKGAENEN